VTAPAEHLRQLWTDCSPMRVSVIRAALRVGQLCQAQLPDIPGQSCLGHYEAVVGQCFAQLVLTLDPALPHNPKDGRMALGLHSERYTSLPPT
jgi:hypothetical protein